MSAFIVSKTTMDYVVTAMADSRVLPFTTTFDGTLRGQAYLDADQMGRSLFDLNTRAVRGRYPSDPEYADYGVEMSQNYRWNPRMLSADPDIKQLCAYVKAIDCLAYQCSDDATIDDPLLAELKAFGNKIEGQIVSQLAEYKAQPWDFAED